ncbi:MAG: helicase C-terminal domain-containing protein [Patescibacteria group bacterium]
MPKFQKTRENENSKNGTPLKMELADLIASPYPLISDPKIQLRISEKKEFNELSSSINEPAPARKGELFKAQKLVLRYLQHYDRIFLMWRTGTGKTCPFIAASEYYKYLAELSLGLITKDFTINTPIQRAIVLVKGPSLRREFVNQLVCRCTAGQYITENVQKATSEKTRKAAITREIKKWYSIHHYRSFASELSKMSDDAIRRRFSDSIFFFDEVHTIRRNDENETEEDQNLIYEQLRRLVRTIERYKLVLASATPMIEKIEEIIPILNILAKEDISKAVERKIIDGTFTLKDISPIISGMVSYVRELESGVTVSYEGYPIDDYHQTITVPVEMSKIQIKAENKLKGGKSDSDDIVEEDSKLTDVINTEFKRENAVRLDERQISNFVFPDGSYGGKLKRSKDDDDDVKGLGKYVISTESNSYEVTPELRKYLENPKELAKLSPKFAFVIDRIKESMGSSFVYSDFVMGGGAILFGLCLEGQGFVRYNDAISAFKGRSDDSSETMCESGGTSDRQVTISKALRYGLFTRETSDAKTVALLELFNSYENRHGEYIKVLIGTPIARDGINLANVQNIFLLGSGWNASGMYQAMSRAIRATSHVDLLTEMKNVNIHVYRMCCVNDKHEGVDIDMYRASEAKDRKIKQMERIFKQCSIDCQIHYNRNVRDTDKDGSAICDYQECRYKCVDGGGSDIIDMSTYNAYYTEEIVREAMERILDLFKYRFGYTIDDLCDYISEIDSLYIKLAVESLITNKIKLLSRFGYPCYLREDRSMVYLVREYPLSGGVKYGYPLNWYVGEMTGTIEGSLADTIKIAQLSDEYGKIKEDLSKVEPGSEEFESLYNSISHNSKIGFFENSLIEYFRAGAAGSVSAGTVFDYLINKYKDWFHELKEPVEEIASVVEDFKKIGTGRGRKRDMENFDPSKFIASMEPGTGKTGETVYLHNLFNIDVTGDSYAETKSFLNASGKYRIFKPSENIGWRDLKDYEIPAYYGILKKQVREIFGDMASKFEIYGTVINGKFRIIDKTQEQDSDDKRTERTGKVCETWTNQELFLLLKRMQLICPVEPQTYPSNEKMIEFISGKKIQKDEKNILLKNWSKDEIKEVYKWIVSGYSRKQICQMLYEYFESENALIIVRQN